MLRLNRRRVVGLLVLVLGITGSTAFAQATSDQQAIEKVIRAQIAAFGRDDASGAFAYSTPGIQALFNHNANAFLESVKHAYQPVYRPGDLNFMQPEKRGGHVLQRVKIGMPDGKVWIASYDMQKQADNHWLINGCQLAIADEVST